MAATASTPTGPPRVRWLREARDDLAAAELLAGYGLHRRRNAAFFAQQAGEKALVAVLLHQRVPPPRVHDLVVLADRVRGGLTLPDREALAHLSNWASGGPDEPEIVPDDLPGDAAFADLLDTARALVAVARRLTSRRPPCDPSRPGGEGA